MRDGRAVVTAGGRACSEAFGRPGVYVVDASGTELLIATEGPAGCGTGVATADGYDGREMSRP